MSLFSTTQQHQEDGYIFPYHYLDLKAPEYRLILHMEYLNRLEVIKRLLQPFTGQSVLDAGCGDGRLCYELRDANLKVVGVDYSERALAFARAFSPNTEFYAADLKTLVLPHQFDAIVMQETLEHFDPADIPAILQGLARHLKPSGKLIITVPSTTIPLIKKHYQHFSPASLRQTLAGYFSVTQCFGHSRLRGSSGVWLFWRIWRLSTFLYPLHYRLPAVTRWLEHLQRYYARHLAEGRPEQCSGLVAVCVPQQAPA